MSRLRVWDNIALYNMPKYERWIAVFILVYYLSLVLFPCGFYPGVVASASWPPLHSKMPVLHLDNTCLRKIHVRMPHIANVLWCDQPARRVVKNMLRSRPIVMVMIVWLLSLISNGNRESRHGTLAFDSRDVVLHFDSDIWWRADVPARLTHWRPAKLGQCLVRNQVLTSSRGSSYQTRQQPSFANTEWCFIQILPTFTRFFHFVHVGHRYVFGCDMNYFCTLHTFSSANCKFCPPKISIHIWRGIFIKAS